MSEPSSAKKAKIMLPFALGVSQFSNKFVQTVSSSAKKDENLICSPLSCLITLAMAQAGAKGRTLEDMTKALCLPENLKETHRGFAELVSKLKLLQAEEKGDNKSKFASREKVDLILSNRVYVKDKNFNIKEDYLTTQEKTFNASALAVDFLDPATADSINKWVETQTENKIKNICSPGSFNEYTSVVLINTIYFKCDWNHTFKAENRRPDTFYLNETKTLQVSMMFQKDDFPLAHLPELDSKLLRLYYKHMDFSFVIILPNEKTGLAALESKLATMDLAKLLQQAKYAHVRLSLPKFTFKTTLNLMEDLKRMGLEIAFDGNRADFSGISNTKPAFISDVIQKAFIEVDEKGTEAAAATMICFSFGGEPNEPEEVFEFICDHPFAFFIVYKGEYTLFAGTMKAPPEDTKPNKKLGVFGWR